ncbi:IclR family transcriptional regulator [Streptomonospora sp. PA3]|uniref:IclR family transcriptional regulator n=1 Tax=Streptomonospora sp. PA3 TaxID=2607326 RepID=UPI0012DF0A67|nr:IclR family transcriptional regulator [Streptomonospora sp. PA3]MUL41081.1 IclR family transcriptional regulator [Streptomonospora sp. PA3]
MTAPDKPPKTAPAYAIASVDHALRLATMLQLEGAISVTDAARRLGVARSTAHRLLAMLVYRDFAVRGDDHAYRPGPVLELAGHSRSRAARLRETALPHLRRLVALLGESANLTVRTGETVRFVAGVECDRALRVGSRDGMVFPAHLTSGGLLLLAELDDEQLDELYAADRFAERPGDRPETAVLRRDLAKVRRAGFAVNQERSERGVVAVGVPIRMAGETVAAVSVSLPSVRYDRRRLPALVGTLRLGSERLEADLAGS